MAGDCRFIARAQARQNLSYPVGGVWQGNRDGLQRALLQLEGVEDIGFSFDGQTVYLKVLQKGFDQAAAEKSLQEFKKCH
ncbi:Drug resistance translocase family protein [Neisseria gonorrhoeae]|uniref:Drug resistance translocase family protein n=1 Tax=Neisseria gonorrhoeae TaxID=485 RepID=A0A378VXK7_NEIGO|nr:Drug resistance translocase family protein [Neisseria gonorrhoeae]